MWHKLLDDLSKLFMCSSHKLSSLHFQMPHESTVAHEQRFVMETPMISRSRTFKLADEEEEHNRPSSVSTCENIFMIIRY